MEFEYLALKHPSYIEIIENTLDEPWIYNELKFGGFVEPELSSLYPEFQGLNHSYWTERKILLFFFNFLLRSQNEVKFGTVMYQYVIYNYIKFYYSNRSYYGTPIFVSKNFVLKTNLELKL